MTATRDSKPRRNGRVAGAVLAVAALMLGLSFASVPLYRIFCQATGLNGTTQVAAHVPGGVVSDRWITVRFNADVAPGLPWSFGPEQLQMRVHPGQQALAMYRATNHSEHAVTGRAVYNVTPLIVGLYFDKIQCFCFNNQTLQPGQTAEMPVTFFVDPKMLQDKDTKGIDTITLSYTFFRAKNSGAEGTILGAADTTPQPRPPSAP